MDFQHTYISLREERSSSYSLTYRHHVLNGKVQLVRHASICNHIKNLIAETVSKLAYKISSLHGKGTQTVCDTGLGGVYKPFLEEFLKNRHNKLV